MVFSFRLQTGQLNRSGEDAPHGDPLEGGDVTDSAGEPQHRPDTRIPRVGSGRANTPSTESEIEIEIEIDFSGKNPQR